MELYDYGQPAEAVALSKEIGDATLDGTANGAIAYLEWKATLKAIQTLEEVSYGVG